MAWPWDTFSNKLSPNGELRRLATLFPSVTAGETHAVLGLIPVEASKQSATGEVLRVPSLLSNDSRLITWNGTQLALPYRVYFQEPAAGKVQRLTNRQQQQLHCLYLRHYDGYVRQRHLEALFTISRGVPEDFTWSGWGPAPPKP